MTATRGEVSRAEFLQDPGAIMRRSAIEGPIAIRDDAGRICSMVYVPAPAPNARTAAFNACIAECDKYSNEMLERAKSRSARNYTAEDHYSHAAHNLARRLEQLRDDGDDEDE